MLCQNHRMTTHTPTMLLVIILVGTVLSVSVGAVANRGQRDGMLYWAVGLMLHTLAYIFLSQADSLGVYFAYLSSIVLRACTWAAFAEGLYQLYRRPAPRLLIWAPVGVTFLAFVLLYDKLVLRVIATSLISAAQGLFVLFFLWRQRRESPGRSKYFLLVGLLITIVILLGRVALAGRGAAGAMVSLTESSPVQATSFLGSIMVMVLLSIGFVLLSKDRADNLNRSLAIRDELTGLANRRRLNEVLSAEWARSRRTDQPLALAMIDIDQFKQYNDQYGHQAGDECLQRVARAIASSAARASDLAARYGGEEFLLILPDTDAAAAQYLAEGLRRSVEALDLPHLHSPSGKVTVSVGVAAVTEGYYKDAPSLLRAADEALYRAKNGGRNQVQVALASLPVGALKGHVPAKLVQLIWRRVYESGNPLIDAQHQALFSDANKLLSALLGGRPMAESEHLVEVFVADIAQHFQDEEALITKAGFSGAAEHALMHRTLLAQASVLSQRFHEGSVSVGELFEYLAHEVVARHILVADREYFASLASADS